MSGSSLPPVPDSGAVARDLALLRPKVKGAHVTIGEVRAQFEDDHVHMVLLVDHAGRLLGTCVRTDLPPNGRDDARALEHAVMEGRTVDEDEPMANVWTRLGRQGVRRLAVVQREGTLVGLICLNRRLTQFCTDAGVEERALEERKGVYEQREHRFRGLP